MVPEIFVSIIAENLQKIPKAYLRMSSFPEYFMNNRDTLRMVFADYH